MATKLCRALFTTMLTTMLVAGVGCTDTSADPTGDYTVDITNANNGCEFANWTPDAKTLDVPVDIAVTDGKITATVQGAAGVYLTALLGSNVFTGSDSSNTLTLYLDGTRAGSMGTCAYTVNAQLRGMLTGDALQGTIIYTPSTNEPKVAGDCGVLSSCTSVQDFSGTRPPAS